MSGGSLFDRTGLRIGQVAGITVRLHWIFLLWGLFELLGSERLGGSSSALMYLGFLFGSVFLHELGHCRAARQIGGNAREVILWPLGGLAAVDIPDRPLSHLAVAIGGPAVNLILWLALLPFVISMEGIEGIGSFFLRQPVSEPIAVAAAVNLDLFVFNLLPALSCILSSGLAVVKRMPTVYWSTLASLWLWLWLWSGLSSTRVACCWHWLF